MGSAAPNHYLLAHDFQQACIGGWCWVFRDACSTQTGTVGVLYLQRALHLGLFFVEFVAAARRHNT